jgi:drug/metabolite transporter (DMT)-like permease
MLLAFSGVVVLMGASLDLAPQHPLGDALALLVAVFYAGYQLTLKHCGAHFPLRPS